MCVCVCVSEGVNVGRFMRVSVQRMHECVHAYKQEYILDTKKENELEGGVVREGGRERKMCLLSHST